MKAIACSIVCSTGLIVAVFAPKILDQYVGAFTFMFFGVMVIVSKDDK